MCDVSCVYSVAEECYKLCLICPLAMNMESRGVSGVNDDELPHS